ncbi:MAG: LysM peptidoglycan-binding domain-containing protein [Rhodanobacteraceae bacterium]
MRRTLRTLFTGCVAALLAACAAQPARQLSPSVAIAAPQAPAPVVATLPPAAPPDIWAALRTRFAMDDCNAGARSQAWARRYTGNPKRFEAQLRAVLPLMMHVQNAAENAGVPGEFVLLPWVESTYDAAEPGRRGDPAGMWQIMPQTARTLGLVINRHYDGRLDPAAATPAVMAMLKGYGDELHDWQLVDMAFNAGEYKMLGMIEGHAGESVNVPRLPVGAITRDHLAKLQALSCIVRDPARYDVILPKPDDGDRLALVALPAVIDLTDAAQLAGLPSDRLRALNPGYHNGRMSSEAPHHLLLPQKNAPILLAAIAARGADTLAQATPVANTKDAVVERDDESTTAPSLSKHAAIAAASKRRHTADTRHKVERGESLWMIARHYHLDPHKLRRWNALASDDLHPGQVLLLSAPD